MTDKNKQRVIAMAAVFQASSEIARLAKDGICDNVNFKVLVDSLFVFNPDNTLEIYGNDLSNLKDGLIHLSTLSKKNINTEYAETIRYTLNLFALEKSLKKQPEMLEVIRSRLNHMQFNREHFNDNQNDLTDKISSLYQDTLSQLPFRIQVTGNMDHLTQKHISDKIRTLLLSGLRSVILWRQLGGTKWQFILGRSKIEAISKELLEQISTTTH